MSQSGLAASHQLSLFSHFFSAPSSEKNEINFAQPRNGKISILIANYYLCISRNIFDNFLLPHPSCNRAWRLHTKLLYFHISFLHLYQPKLDKLSWGKGFKSRILMINSYLCICRNIFDNFLLSHPSCSRAWRVHTKFLYFHISSPRLYLRKIKWASWGKGFWNTYVNAYFIPLHIPQYFWQLSFAISVLQSGLADSHQVFLFSHFFSAKYGASLVQINKCKLNCFWT